MTVQFGNRQYEMLCGSYAINDGMFLEANDVTEQPYDTVLFAF